MEIKTKFSVGDMIMTVNSKSKEIYAGKITKVEVVTEESETSIVYTVRANERECRIFEHGARALTVDNVVNM